MLVSIMLFFLFSPGSVCGCFLFFGSWYDTFFVSFCMMCVCMGCICLSDDDVMWWSCCYNYVGDDIKQKSSARFAHVTGLISITHRCIYYCLQRFFYLYISFFSYFLCKYFTFSSFLLLLLDLRGNLKKHFYLPGHIIKSNFGCVKMKFVTANKKGRITASIDTL